LAATFLRQLASEGLPDCELGDDAHLPLMSYCWPGNVRQLRNVLEQAVIEAQGAVLHASDLAPLLDEEWGQEGEVCSTELPDNFATPAMLHASAAPEKISASRGDWTTLAELEREHLARTLEFTFFNRAAAARLLGISRQALLRKMERYGISGREG
jgi:DNA-binding NtrC family response regulator